MTFTAVGDPSSGRGSEAVASFSDDQCSGSVVDQASGDFDFVIGAAVSGVAGAYEIDLLNREAPGSTNVYDIFRIEDGTLAFGEWPEKGPVQPQFRPASFPANPIEFDSL